MACLQTPCDNHPFCSAHMLCPLFLFRMAARAKGRRKLGPPPPGITTLLSILPSDCKLYLVVETPQRKYARQTILAPKMHETSTSCVAR
jgi:hypothetical protein